MELGGKSALLVFNDADVEKAVEWCMVSLPALIFCLPCHPSMWQIFAGLPRASLLQYLATCVPAVQCCMLSLTSCLMSLISLPLYYDNNRSAKYTTLHAQDWVEKGLEPTSVAYVYPLSCGVMHGERIAPYCYLSSLSIGTIAHSLCFERGS